MWLAGANGLSKLRMGAFKTALASDAFPANRIVRDRPGRMEVVVARGGSASCASIRPTSRSSRPRLQFPRTTRYDRSDGIAGVSLTTGRIPG